MRNLKSFLYNVMAEELENVAQAALYCLFGELIYEENAFWMLDTIPRYLFNGKELDEESGMYYYSARYYAPPTFISRDPLFEEYFWSSPYAYCLNNPVKYIDPDGRKVIPTTVLLSNTSVSGFLQNVEANKISGGDLFKMPDYSSGESTYKFYRYYPY